MSKKHTLEIFDKDLNLLREEVQCLADQAKDELERAMESLLKKFR